MFFLDLLKTLRWSVHQWRDYHRDWGRELAQLGRNCRLAPGLKISHPDRVTIGDGVTINAGTVINGSAGVEIGAHTVISYNCAIWTGDHRYADGALLPFDNTILDDGVVIGECVWLGFGAIVVPGVTIGEGAVVGMGAVVCRDVPPLSVAVGCPARVVKIRDSDHYWRLKEANAFLR